MNGVYKMAVFGPNGVFPDNFFTLLTLSNKESYIESLFVLWNRYIDINGQMTKNDSIAALISHFDIKILELAEDENYDSQKEKQLDFTLKSGALSLIRTLIKYGWLEEDPRPKEMEVYIKIPYSAFKQIESIQQTMEPAEDISTNYSLNVRTNINSISLKNKADDLLYLENAHRDTRNLINVLCETFDRMKKFYEHLLEKATYDSVLQEHFEEYAKNIVETRFHPMLTNKNTLRDRQSILSKLTEIEYDDEIMEILMKSAQIKYRTETEADAENKVYNKLNYIKESFQNIDNLRESLKRLHNQYLKVTMEKLMYLSSRDEDLKDNIYELLQLIRKHPEKASIVSKNIKMNDFSQITTGSFYSQRKNKTTFKPSNNNKINISDVSGEEESINTLLEKRTKNAKINPFYSKDSIEKFLEENFKESDEFNTKDLRIENDTDYIKLVMSLNYTGKPKFKYEAEINEDRVETEKYTYPEITFSRKENK